MCRPTRTNVRTSQLTCQILFLALASIDRVQWSSKSPSSPSGSGGLSRRSTQVSERKEECSPAAAQAVERVPPRTPGGLPLGGSDASGSDDGTLALARPEPGETPGPAEGEGAEEGRHSVTVGVWLALVAAFGYSFKAVLIKLAYPMGVDAITLLVMRMGFALPFFLWLGSRAAPPADAEPLKARDWVTLTVLSLAGYYGAAILDFVGLRYITAGLERLIIFSHPTFTVLIGVFAFGRAWKGREVASLVLSYAGIGLALAHDLRIGGEGRTVLVGCGLVLGSTLCYAGYLAGSDGLIRRLGPSRFAAAAVGISTLATAGHFALARPLATLLQPWPVLLISLALALFSTVIPVLALVAAIHRLGSNRAALVGSLGPVLTIGLSWLILGETVSLAQLAGAALVIAGVRVAARA
ncbi:MAG: DMT family transporter [Deltaproteobacteria bacterium]|nr:DMT family transporter [Deltaproteobacteria bacterium]